MNVESIFFIAPFNWSCIWASIFCGSLIGLDRQLKGKPVGIRTSSLIVLGTYFFVTISIFVNNDVTDPSRIIGQIVTGVGFLGAGVMMTKEGLIVGVTSAATIWSLASLGICISIVGPLVAIKLSIIVVVILSGVDFMEGYFSTLSRGVHSKYSSWRNKSNKQIKDSFFAGLD